MFTTSPPSVDHEQQELHNITKAPPSTTMTDGLFGPLRMLGTATMIGSTVTPLLPPVVAAHISGPPKHGDIDADFAGDHASFGWGDFPVLTHSALPSKAFSEGSYAAARTATRKNHNLTIETMQQ